jgi:hypothetical protein
MFIPNLPARSQQPTSMAFKNSGDIDAFLSWLGGGSEGELATKNKETCARRSDTVYTSTIIFSSRAIARSQNGRIQGRRTAAADERMTGEMRTHVAGECMHPENATRVDITATEEKTEASAEDNLENHTPKDARTLNVDPAKSALFDAVVVICKRKSTERPRFARCSTFPP